MFPLFIRFVFF